MDNRDLSISQLMAMPDEAFDAILGDPEALRKIGCDERHIRVVLFHMLRKNLKAIESFSRTSEKSSRTSICLTWAIVALVVVQIVVAVVGCLAR